MSVMVYGWTGLAVTKLCNCKVSPALLVILIAKEASMISKMQNFVIYGEVKSGCIERYH